LRGVFREIHRNATAQNALHSTIAGSGGVKAPRGNALRDFSYTLVRPYMAVATTRVSGDYVQGSFGLLTLSGERARASLFFARQVGVHAHEQNFELARWYLRAALSEFRSIFDLLNADLKSMQLSTQWKRSEYKGQLEADPIVSILRKVRDFVVHSAQVKGIEKNFVAVFPDGYPERRQDMPSLVIDPLDRQALTEKRGNDEFRNFSDQDLDCFNTEARRWPADLLIHIAVYKASIPLSGFLATSRAHVA